MARDNYSYQKYRRELAKKKKKEEKMQRKLAKKNMVPEGSTEQVSGEGTALNQHTKPFGNSSEFLS